MRKIPIKNLYKTLSKELAELPFAITKKGRIVAYVVPGSGPDRTPNSLDHKPNSLDQDTQNETKTPPDMANGLDQKPNSLDQNNLGLDARLKYKSSHPRDICLGCQSYNKDCICETN